MHKTHCLLHQFEIGFRNQRFDYLDFPRLARIIHVVVQAAPSQRVGKIARTVTGQHDKWMRGSAYGAEFRYRDLIFAQCLKQISLESFVGAIDFVDEPLDTLGGEALRSGLAKAAEDIDVLLREAERGQKLRDGLHAVIVGPPNAGKSSLLNALAGSDRAIVSDIAGTTRDLLRETVRVDGVELTLVDTAGLRAGGDTIEREGMRRATSELTRADLAIVVLDARAVDTGRTVVADSIADVPQRLWVINKTDLLARLPAAAEDEILVSARTGAGLDRLHAKLRALAGGVAEGADGAFSARLRQVEALRRTALELAGARQWLDRDMLELSAESLRIAHDTLGEITGRVAPDDLLGHIFSSFCIGK